MASRRIVEIAVIAAVVLATGAAVYVVLNHEPRGERLPPEPAPASVHGEDAWVVCRQIGGAWDRQTEPALAAFAKWVREYQSAPESERTARTSEGVARAEARYEVMARLVTNDPCRALEAALPPEVREALPPDVVAHLAVPVSDAGVLTAASTTIRPSDIPGHRILSCRAMMGRQSYVAAICAQGAAPRLGLETSIHGLAAGEALAVLESPLLVVRDSGTAESLESLLREPAFRGFHPPPARGAKGGGLTLRWKSHTFHVPSVRFAQALEAHLLAAGGS